MDSEQPTQPVEYVRRSDNRRRPRRGCGCLGRLFVGGILVLALIIFGGILLTLLLIYSGLSSDIEDGIAALDAARNRQTFETTFIYDRSGRTLWEIFGEGKRTQVPLALMPQELVDATVATEDDTFYDNIGLDAPSLMAALIANLRNPADRPPGGSTITQQLVRHIVFEYDERTAVSYSRKTKEMILAWLMNRKYAKDEILEMYLNEIYYGNLAYGVEAAAETYFDKPAVELNLAESALLAGLPQSPVTLDPYRNLEAAKERQWLVLNLMVNEGFISRPEAEQAYLASLTFAPQEVSLEAPHFAVYVRQLLEEQFGADLVANGGLRITTTLDLDYQRLAEMLARQHIAEVGLEHNMTNAALVALKPGTGEILAMLGSLDYRDDRIDGNVNVTLTNQQPGSAIKPLTYAAALSPQPDSGQPLWTAADLLWDVPVKYDQFGGAPYAPVNYDGRFHGPVRLRDALANSYNVPAILLLQDLGVSRFLEQAGRMGISTLLQDPAQYGLSLTLGGGDVTPLELTAAYATFANGGFRIPPTAILHVETSDGEVLYDYQPPPAESVLDPRVAFLISDILDDDAARVPAMGRDNPLDLPFPAAAKTGTSNDFRDNWTVGYTPGLVVGVWTGNTDNSEMNNISGLSGAAPLWSSFMLAVYGDYALLAKLGSEGAQPPTEFVPPAGLEKRHICDLPSVTLGAVDCSLSDSEWFLVDNQPSEPDAGLVQESVMWHKVDPGVWRVPAVPLPPLPEELQLAMESNSDSDSLPIQSHCTFAEGLAVELLPPDVAPILFFSPPRNPESLKPAHEWAAEHDLPILPAAGCSDEVLAARNGNIPAVWRITSPKPGEAVSGIMPILGTVQFEPKDVQFYKLELGAGDLNNPAWLTLGETRSTPVINGTLEMLHADALAPGDYLLRLIVVGWDGNYIGPPHEIQVSIY